MIIPAAPSRFARAIAASNSSRARDRDGEGGHSQRAPGFVDLLPKIGCCKRGADDGDPGGRRDDLPEEFDVLPMSPGTIVVSPVTLPSGRAKFVTTPCPMGSATTVKTIGIDDVARLAASVSLGAVVTMMSIFAFTRSAANAGKCSGSASAPK